MADRIDDLLEQALETGTIPSEATQAERAELELLLAGTAMLRAAKVAAEADAAAAKPIARARFERFAAQHQAAATAARARAPQAAKPPRGPLRHLVALATGVRGVALAAAIGLIAVVAVFATQNLRNTTESAAAAFEPGDYVQLQGTVESASPGTLHLRYELGTVDVDIADATTVIDDGTAIDPSSLKAGDSVLVGGVVGENRRVSARTLAVSEVRLPEPSAARITRLEALEGKLPGRVVAFALAPNGRGRVTLETADGRRLLVIVDARSAERLVALGAIPGRRVVVGGVSPAGERVYFLEFEGSSPPPPSSGAGTGTGTTPRPTLTPASGGTPAASVTRPAGAATAAGGTVARPDGASTGMVRVSGTLLAREGLVLTLATDRGTATVHLRPDTRVLVGESGITLREWAAGATGVGHTMTVSGGIDARSGVVVADVVVVGPKP